MHRSITRSLYALLFMVARRRDRNPPEFLKAGDLIETEVERIGLLRNRMVATKVPTAR